jgi:hypothetical protein
MFQDHQNQGSIMGTPVTTPATEVVARPVRRRHTLAYKLTVLETVAKLRTQGNGAIGAYLRSEGLYYSSIQSWERSKSQGKLTTNRGRTKPKSREDLLAEIKRLRRHNEQLEKRLKKTELIVELQKKLSQVLQTDDTFEKSDEQ